MEDLNSSRVGVRALFVDRQSLFADLDDVRSPNRSRFSRFSHFDHCFPVLHGWLSDTRMGVASTAQAPAIFGWLTIWASCPRQAVGDPAHRAPSFPQQQVYDSTVAFGFDLRIVKWRAGLTIQFAIGLPPGHGYGRGPRDHIPASRLCIGA